MPSSAFETRARAKGIVVRLKVSAALAGAFALEMPTFAAATKPSTDRHAAVSRHNVVLTELDRGAPVSTVP